MEVETGSGPAFLHHPLLRGGFLDDVYECFDDLGRANEMMARVSKDLWTVRPLMAQRCVMSGWKRDAVGEAGGAVGGG